MPFFALLVAKGMELRELVAYLLILAIVVVIASAWLYATRERRAHRASVRRAKKRKQDRISES